MADETTPNEAPPAAPAASETAETAPEAPAAAPLTAAERDEVEVGIVEALKTVFDPEIPVNIYELGLIYDVEVQESGHVDLKMTLTSPGCPVAGSLPGEVEVKVRNVPGVASAQVELVWDPVWNPSMMSEAARLTLGML
jgi:FeS assembly SUF system protein